MYKNDKAVYVNPSDGEHDAVIIGWEDRGISQTTYDGKTREVHQAVIKYEILDETLPEDESFGAGNRLVLWDWVNIAFSKNAKLTERRVAILGLNPEDSEARNRFDERETLGVRMILYVKKNENGNAKVLDNRRHEDQDYGPLENQLTITSSDGTVTTVKSSQDPQTPADEKHPDSTGEDNLPF
jgi:hypothetical protein